MAEISLKIKSDFEQAQAAFKSLGTLSESAQKQLAKLQAQMEKGSEARFTEKNKLNAAAITATRGAAAGLEAEYKGLQREIERLIRKGIDPQSESLMKLKSRYSELGSQLPQASGGFSTIAAQAAKFGMVLGTAAIANKLYDIAAGSIKAAAGLEQQQVAFTTMLGSAGKANALLQQIQTFAEATPFQFPDLVDASKRMIAFGFTAQEVIPKLGAVGNVAAGLSQPIGDMIYLFGQVKTQGKAMTQDLNQFANRGVPIFEELAKVIYETQKPTDAQTASIRKLGEQGKITYSIVDAAFKNMTSSGGKFANLMSNQANTLGGQWSNFNDKLDRTAVLLGQTMMSSAKNMVGVMTNLVGLANNLLEKYNQMSMNQQHAVGTLELWNYSLGDVGKKLVAIAEYEKQNAEYALLYNEYMAGHLKLSDKQIADLQTVLKLNRSIEEIKGSAKKEDEKGNKKLASDMAAAKKSGAGSSAQKTELQLYQEHLNKMAQSEASINAERLKIGEDYFSKKMELEQLHGDELAAWQEEQATMIANNTKLSFDQRIAAMDALSKAVKKKSESDMKNFAQFGGQIMGNASSMFSDLITVMNNAGKSSKAFAIGLKITSAAEAGINSFLAFTQVLRDPTIWPSWLRIPLAGTILAAGLAKQAAIWSTPIAETGLSNYEVPDVSQNRNDSFPVKAQAGEKVTVTPRGEDSGSGTSVNISIGESQVFRIMQKGAKSGKINLNNKNIRRGVFAH